MVWPNNTLLFRASTRLLSVQPS